MADRILRIATILLLVAILVCLNSIRCRMPLTHGEYLKSVDLDKVAMVQFPPAYFPDVNILHLPDVNLERGTRVEINNTLPLKVDIDNTFPLRVEIEK